MLFKYTRIVESVARTDKLHCSECNKKIKKGDTVYFDLYTDGRRKPMKDCYCTKCGHKIKEAQDMNDAFADAIGIGQD